MNRYIITFGQDHAHRVNGTTFDKDSVAVIKANSYPKARDIAFELFEGKFCAAYPENHYDKDNLGRYFPRGKFPANFKEDKGEAV